MGIRGRYNSGEVMEFRPCIDIHNGSVKQIVGSTLKDKGDTASENFVSKVDADYYATLYRDKGLKGGHVILLNSKDSDYYEATKKQALKALKAYPGGLQVGGGITADNANDFIKAGASHVIVTSYVFRDGLIDFERLRSLTECVGREHLVLDLSCKRVADDYIVVTDRWQKFTSEKVTHELLDRLAEYCDEFLIHAVDVEGKSRGIEERLVELLADYEGPCITYAGGIGNLDILRQLRTIGKDRIHATIGSGLDIFGGTMSIDSILDVIK